MSKVNYGQGIREDYDKNGNLRCKYTLTDGRFDGVWEEYYKNGNMKSRGYLKEKVKNEKDQQILFKKITKG